jgi:membrane-associated phospholipid phosphatase
MTKEFLRTPFVILTVGLIIILAYPLLIFPKGELVILINTHHHPAADLFFKYFTHAGDGVVLALLLVLLLFYSFKLSIITALSIVFQSVLVSVFKRWLFHGLPRPTAFFGDEINWHFIDGVDVHGSNTFPSGHTATAFALFALMVVIFNNRGYVLSVLFFSLAFLVGLSRMYLLQHFMVDAYFGAIFGVLSVVFALLVMDRIFNTERMNALHQKSLTTTLFKK